MSAVLGTYARANVEFERGEGAYLWTVDGERYLDFAAGVAVNVLGHAHPHLVEALTAQARKVWHTSNLYRVTGQERLQAALRGNVRRQGFLREFRRRGDGSVREDGAEIP